MKLQRHLIQTAGIAAALFATAAPSQAQIDWISFQEDATRLSVANNLGAGDTEEKDYAWGDLDKDGWTDLIIVRKQPFTTQGRKPNVLLMNENGTLTDRTAQYASASDVGGDNGFLTPTNDRDVIIVDVDNDGWDDVVTSTTLTPNQSKAISHPRIYMNLGNDGGGNWLGLRFEAGRTPQIKVNGSNYFPFFCGIGFGDVTGDGFADLYFADYDVAGFNDVNDRLFVNDGTGSFADESTSRLSTAMLKSPFGTSSDIADMNGDGVLDVIKNTGLGQTTGNPLVAISYNDPNNEGFFNLLDQPFQGNPYHVSVGDLNQDGKPDMIISDDAADRFMLNQGNDGLGRVNWSAAFTFQVSDDGFGSNNIIVDIDDDGWKDAIICDVDVDIPGCSRRMHIYHNKGGQVGGNITMKEEAGGGSKGVTGISGNSQVGTHDIAVFDIDNDGDKDFVVGRCSGTQVYMNLLIDGNGDLGLRYCDPAVDNSSGQPGVMTVQGSDVANDNDVTLIATQLPNNKFGYFLTSMTQDFIANPGGSQGNLCLGGTIGRYVKDIQNSGGAGSFQLAIDTTQLPPPLSTAIQAGDTWNFTTWYRDNNPNTTSNFTDAVSVLFQ